MLRGYGSAMGKARRNGTSTVVPPPSVTDEVAYEQRAERTGLERFYRVIPVLSFLFSTLILGYVSPGMQYDEAIFESGAVRLLAQPTRLPPSRPATLKIGSVYLPLMVLPYAGAMKDYLVLLPFALFGT